MKQSLNIAMSRWYGVGVVGSMMIDFVAYSSRIPTIGDTIFGSKCEKNYGGKGANQAFMAAKLLDSVSMFCKVGPVC